MAEEISLLTRPTGACSLRHTENKTSDKNTLQVCWSEDIQKQEENVEQGNARSQQMGGILPPRES